MSDDQQPADKDNWTKHCVGVAGTVGVFACGVGGVFLIFAGPGGAWPAAFAIAALAFMGIFIAYFISKKN
jgi:hypothetical protein